MRTSSTPFLIVMISFSFMTGCGQKNPPAEGSFRNEGLGTLEKQIDAIQRELPKTACDYSMHDAKKRIAKILIPQEKKILDFLSQVENKNSDIPFLDFGIGKIGLDHADQKKPGHDQAKTIPYSGWKEQSALLEKLKDDTSIESLASLYLNFIFLMDEDYRRVVHKLPSYLTENDRMEIIPLQKELQSCFISESCSIQQLPKPLQEKLSRDTFYREASNFNKNIILHTLISRLVSKNRNHSVTRSPSTDTQGTIHIKLFSETLNEDDFNHVQDWMDQYWNKDPRIKIQIERIESIDGKNYQIEQDEHVGRSYVDHQERKMKLFNFETQKVFVHEMGHILGLVDEYYTRFNEKSCQYEVEINDGNLMSQHSTGTVLERHIEELISLYLTK